MYKHLYIYIDIFIDAYYGQYLLIYAIFIFLAKLFFETLRHYKYERGRLL